MQETIKNSTLRGLTKSFKNQIQNFVSKFQVKNFGLFAHLAIFGILIFPNTLAKPTILTNTSNSLNNTKANYDICSSPECEQASERILEYLDTTVNPCDDFYQFACGSWIADRKEAHQFTTDLTTQLGVLNEKVEAEIQEILEKDETPDDSPGLKSAKLYYNACKSSSNIDDETKTSEDKELREFISYLLADIEKTTDFDGPEFARTLGKIRRELGGTLTLTSESYVGGNYLFSVRTEFDAKDLEVGVSSPVYELQFRPAVLSGEMRGLPVESVELLAEVIAKVWHILYPEETTVDGFAEAIANQIIEVESFLAVAKSSASRWEKSLFRYNYLSQHELNFFSDNAIDWKAFLQESYGEIRTLDFKTLKVSVLEGQYFKNLKTVLRVVTVDDMKRYLKWRIILDLAFTNTNIRDAFKGKITFPERSPAVCAYRTHQYFSTALTFPYIQSQFNESMKRPVGEMVQDLKSAFHSLLDENTWLEPNDVAVAKRKVDAMRTNIGYPILTRKSSWQPAIKHWDSFFNNTLVAIKFQSTQLLARFGEAKSYAEWPGSALEANAFYDSYRNSITVPAGALQLPLYGNPMQYLNFGSMGSIIAHEITHGFDLTGRLFDEDGAYKKWWHPNTTKEYIDKAVCFVLQYNGYVDPDCLESLDGLQTLNENIADSGVRLAFNAYQNYAKQSGIQESALPGLDYTPNQMFFLAFAQTWCEAVEEEACSRRIQTGKHSSGRFRVTGALANFEEFHKTWNCPASIHDTCRIW